MSATPHYRALLMQVDAGVCGRLVALDACPVRAKQQQMPTRHPRHLAEQAAAGEHVGLAAGETGGERGHVDRGPVHAASADAAVAHQMPDPSVR